MPDFIEILHINSSITTLQGFAEENLVVLDNEFTVNDLLSYEGNNIRVGAAYVNNAGQAASVDRLETPTLIRVPKSRVAREIAAVAGNVVFPNDQFSAFLGNEISEIIANPSYTRLNITAQQKSDKGGIFRIYNTANVWCWSQGGGSVGSEGVLLNLTPFVESITTNVGQNGGNFSVQLLPVLGQFDEEEGWRVNPNSATKYFYRGQDNFVMRYPSIQIKDSGEVLRHEPLFHKIIGPNDVFFIQFEVLDNEEERINNLYSNLQNNMKSSPLVLPGSQFDMIGLVDGNSHAFDSDTNRYTVSITGRDGMKLLLEDGCYFFPLDFATENGGFLNASRKGSMRRLVNGELVFFNAYVDRSIEFSMRFIFNQLANIKVCSDELFQFYTDRAYRYDIADETIEGQKTVTATVNDYESNSGKYNKVESPGIWQGIRLIIDREIAGRRIVDSSISAESGSLINYVRKVCQEPFVEFFGETFGDKYYFIVRKPPFTGQAIKSYIDNGAIVDIPEDYVFQVNLQYDDQNVYSWYRLIPRGNFFGDSDGISLAYFPAIFLEEFANKWGSRPYQQVTNYIDYNGFQGDERAVNLNYLKDQATQDLAFMVETNAYLPFTRKGQIIMRGDRRIKRGMFVRAIGTREIFYVDQVNQTYNFSEQSNDRLTVINVSRGMKEEYMDETKKINYFNIVDLDKDESGRSQSNNFQVNPEVFDFFMRRRDRIDEE
jgi:hypothetical protein